MPEKQLHEVARAWREQYDKGRLAFERNNLDYAIALLTQVLEKEPAFYACREALRAAQFKRGGGGGLLRRIGAAPKLVQARVSLRKNPLEALHLVEEVLNSDPLNLEAHKLLAEAALAADLPQTARLSLEIVYKHAPQDREVALRLAPLLAAAGQGAKAEAILQALAAAHPHDSQIAQAVKDLAAQRTLTEGGYAALEDGKGSYRDILRNEQEAVALEQEKRDPQDPRAVEQLIAEYQTRLAREPDNPRAMRALADLYAENGQLNRALELYERLRAVESGDPALERAIAQVREKQYDQELARLDASDPEQAARAEALRRERDKFRLAAARARVDRYPNDLQLRYELGLLYFELNRLPEAIQEFQKAQNHPHLRLQALYHLGQCFARRRMYDLAVRTFENALKEKLVFDEEKKTLLYALGTALEALGRRDQAMEQFKLIYEADIGFKDVAARVDAYYAEQHSKDS